jgi:hypothetical protein
MTDEERRQKCREAALKGAQTKGADRLREAGLKSACGYQGQGSHAGGCPDGPCETDSRTAERGGPEGGGHPQPEPGRTETRGRLIPGGDLACYLRLCPCSRQLLFG